MMKIKTKGKEYRTYGIEEAQVSGIFIDTHTLKSEKIFVKKQNKQRLIWQKAE